MTAEFSNSHRIDPGVASGILSVDPGVGGGLAWIGPPGSSSLAWDMPITKGKGARRDYDLPACWDLAREVNPSVIAIEQLRARPRGTLAAWSLSRGVTLWESIAVGLGCRLERIAPKRWQAILGCEAGEDASLARARELFPEADLKREKHSGRAAALLIGEATRRLLR